MDMEEKPAEAADSQKEDKPKQSPEEDRELAGPRVHEEDDFFRRLHMPRSTHWSIAWSDLMMTMFILFLVMYVYKDANKIFLSSEGLGGDTGKVVGAGAPLDSGGGLLGDSELPLEKSMSKIYDLSRQTVEEEDLGGFATVNLVPDETVRIILTGDLLFDLGMTDLKPDAKRSLKVIAGLIRRTPYMINVVGHTDDVPITSGRFPSNWELSALRASAVARFMIGEMKMPAKRFYITGHSSYRPVKPNDSRKNRSINRRVEIVITKEMPSAS